MGGHFVVERLGGPAYSGRVRNRIEGSVGTICDRLCVPCAVHDVEVRDELTGTHVVLRSTALFTRIAINGESTDTSEITDP